MKYLAALDVAATIDWFDRYFKRAHPHYPLLHDDYAKVKRELVDAGFKKNAHVGKDPISFGSTTSMGEYIIGQLMDFPNHLGPHSVAMKFIEEYYDAGGNRPTARILEI